MKITDADLQDLFRRRQDQEFWENHPTVSQGAILPTGPVNAAIALVIAQGRKQRGCAAFWAHPSTGKSSCIRALEVVLRERFPGCGIAVHEAKSNNIIAEGSFIADILHSLDYQGKIQRDLPAKREQIRRALFALGAERRHVFFVVDEAQELDEQEFRWLKEQGNWLTQKGYKVTTVLFGQEELIDLRNKLLSHGRSDLVMRFFANMYEFELIKSYRDLEAFLEGCDVGSEYPKGTGWSYTRVLWPQAYDSGLRLRKQAQPFWLAFAAVSPLTGEESGVGMNYVAGALAELADRTRERDTAHFRPTSEDWAAAINGAGYADRAPLVRKPARKTLVAANA